MYVLALLPLLSLFIIVLIIVFFIRRKNKFWFNYCALFAEILYLVYINFKIEHYPFTKEIAITGSIFAILAFMGSIAALKRKKIEATLQLGIAVSVYVYISISLALSASQHIYTSTDLDNIVSKLRKTELPDSAKHFTITHHKDSVH